MDWIEQSLAMVRPLLPFLIALAAATTSLGLAHWLLVIPGRERAPEQRVPRNVAMLFLTALALVGVILTLPVSESTLAQLLGLLGVVFTAVIAISSTTFVSNAMAGLMLRAVKNFRPGDFVRIGDNFGRVTMLGIFHTEIQTEERDLTTLPNLFLVTQPLTVVRSSGTIVSATLSLGYETAHGVIEPLLARAAAEAGLDEPFVQILELGNHAVEYRVAGFLPDPKQILSARSRLRACALDTLHGAGIEIVSPTFMNQRPLAPDVRVLPEASVAVPASVTPEAPRETLVFDKATRAEALETLRTEQKSLLGEVEKLEEQRKTADDAERQRLEAEIAERRERAERIEEGLRQATAKGGAPA